MTVFVIAMKSEAEPIVSAMKKTVKNMVHGREVITGKIGKKKTAVVVCGVGKANAAAGAEYAIDCLRADKIVNIGLAGGLNAGTVVGEIYGVSHAVQYDFDLSEINKTPVGTLNEYSEPYIEIDTLPLYPLKRLATGDRFNDDKGDYKFLTKVLGADLRDMELGAIAQVCKHAGVPCYSFKAVSDVAGAGSTCEQFIKNTELCTQNVAAAVEKIFGAVNG